MIFKRAFAAGFTTVFLLASTASAGPLEDGIATYDAGEFSRSMELLLPLAESGTAKAQFLVGQMHDFGQSVVQDDSKALTWYWHAAKQGHSGAQFGVALMFDSGESIPQNFVESYAWASIAADQGDPDAAGHRDLMVIILSARELVRAKKLAVEFWEKYVFPFRN